MNDVEEITIEESGMIFGKYPKNQFFYVEKSEQYTKSLCRKGIKTCEFILQRGKKLLVVEAKSSCPKQLTKSIPNNDWEMRKAKYDDFISEIVLKMRHTLSLYGNILLKRHSQKDVPKNLLDTDLSQIQIILLLVINPPNGTWKPDPELQDVLRKKLQSEIKLWNVNSLIVINAETARKKQLIL